MESSKRLGQVLTDLKLAIDQIDSSFKNARDLILELARILDESGECERRSISTVSYTHLTLPTICSV